MLSCAARNSRTTPSRKIVSQLPEIALMQHPIGPFKRQDDAFCRDPRSIGFLVPTRGAGKLMKKTFSKAIALSSSPRRVRHYNAEVFDRCHCRTVGCFSPLRFTKKNWASALDAPVRIHLMYVRARPAGGVLSKPNEDGSTMNGQGGWRVLIVIANP